MRVGTGGTRWGHPVAIALLGLNLLALLGIGAFVLWERANRAGDEVRSERPQHGPTAEAKPATPEPSKPEPPKPVGGTGQPEAKPATPEPSKPEPPKPVGDPGRIKNVLQQGKTYETTMKTGIEATVMDKDWGVRTTCHLNYVFEARVRRTVEHNDGRTIRARYHIVESRAVKVLSKAQVRFDLGPVGTAILGMLSLEEPLKLLYAFFDAGAKKQLEKQGVKVKAWFDSLEGKQFRITYVDGQGVTQITPIGCELTADERAYLEGLSVLADCYFLPDVESRPGTYWDVEAHAFMDLLPASWRGRPRGVVTAQRLRDYEKGDSRYAVLKIDRGSFEVNASDATRRRQGSLTPRGELHYNISAGFVEKGELRAKGHIEEVSTDHLLFEARFESTPSVEIQYHCRILGDKADAPR